MVLLPRYMLLRFSMMDDFYPPNMATGQANLNPVGVGGGFGQNIPDDAFGEPTASLILFQYNGYFQAGADVGSFGAVSHGLGPLFLQEVV